MIRVVDEICVCSAECHLLTVALLRTDRQRQYCAPYSRRRPSLHGDSCRRPPGSTVLCSARKTCPYFRKMKRIWDARIMQRAWMRWWLNTDFWRETPVVIDVIDNCDQRNNIKMDYKLTAWERVEWIDVAQDRDDWRCCGCSNDSGPLSISQCYKPVWT